jgi:hypothetical protein
MEERKGKIANVPDLDTHSDESGIMKQAFRLLLDIDLKSEIVHKYLRYEMDRENLEFRRQVYIYKKVPDSQKKNSAKTIYDEFISENAPKSINTFLHTVEVKSKKYFYCQITDLIRYF